MSHADAERMRFAIATLNQNRLARILAPLVHRNTHLTQCEEGFRYVGGKGDASRLTAAIPEADVRALLTQDLIERAPRGLRISAAGRAWLKRALATGDAFQAQHSARRADLREVEAGVERPVIVNDAESPLAWLARRKDKSGAPLIAAYQFAAGERLRADYTYAALGPRVTASYSLSAGRQGGGANSAGHLTDTVLAARQRVTGALVAVGPELASILLDVCCHLKGLEEAEREEGWPQRSGKVVLQIALTRLARHYGLISDAHSSSGITRRLRHWGTSDYRPSIEGGAPPQDTAEAS
jgi:Domain of unknown function (DUF6456)